MYYAKTFPSTNFASDQFKCISCNNTFVMKMQIYQQGLIDIKYITLPGPIVRI